MSPYDYIKKEIILGNMKPGDVFDEKSIANELKLSRTPVREEVLRLNQEGYLTIIPRKGTIVSNISITDIKEVYDFRFILEPIICEKACSKMSSSLLMKWKEYLLNIINDNLDKLVIPVEVSGIDDIDKEFHKSIADSLNNKYISEEINLLMEKSTRIRYLSSINSEERYKASLYEHILIIDSLLAKDEKKAKEMMTNHLNKTLEGYRI